jgi:rhomboid protease GluP
MPGDAPAVRAILVINLAIFVLQQAIPHITGDYGLFPPAIVAGQWYRLLTPIVLHEGILHIAFNSYALWIFGPNVEQAFGTKRFVAIYVVSGFLGSVASFALSGCNILGVGASGAIFGTVGALGAYVYARRDQAIMNAYFRNILFIIGINFVIGVTIPNIDIWAHAGGVAAGAILGFGFDRGVRRDPGGTPDLRVTLILVAVGIAVVIWRIVSFAC